MFLFSVLLLLAQPKGTHPECGARPMFDRGLQYSRIIGGMEAQVGEFPWLVSIQAESEHFCGGSIINEWWILTAAHCLNNDKVEPKDLSVVLGTNDLQSPDLEIKGVSRIVLHKDFERSSMNNDIALLLLSSYIMFNSLKVPICMPRQPSPSKWSECWVAGWGQTNPNDKNSAVADLVKVPMIIMDWENCSKVHPKLTKNMLCAGYKNESYDACQGDSGGPLICTTDDRKWYQVGIISWGKSCGQKDIPGVYTVLENYSHWIKRVTEVEGRPYDAEKMRTRSPQIPKVSQAPEFPEPGSPRLWLLLCVLSHTLS